MHAADAPGWTFRPFLAWAGAYAAAAALLAATLPPDAWYVGDSGIKLAATRQAAAHPTRPLELPLPAIPSSMAPALPQPFLLLHGDHTHAVTPELFPLLAAPFYAAFGLRGIYVLPALGWMLAALGTIYLATLFGIRAPAWLVAVCAFAATPLLFYGLEFWEHAPATACVVAAACCLFAPAARKGAMLAAGACCAAAVLFRPEAAWPCIGLVIAALVRRLPPARLAALLVGAALALFPITVYNLAHFGRLLSPHLRVNLGGFSVGGFSLGAFNLGAFNARAAAHAWLDRLGLWMLPHRSTTWAALALLAIAHLAARVRPIRTAAIVIGLAVILFLSREAIRGRDVLENFFRVFPLALLALAPGVAPTPNRRALWIVLWIATLGCVVTAPNDGGGQWGPRYLVATTPFWVLLALDAYGHLASRFRWVHIVGGIVVAAGLLVSRSAYRELRETKDTYETVAREIAHEAAGVAHVVTDDNGLSGLIAGVRPPEDTIFADGPAAGQQLLAAFVPDPVLLVRRGTNDASAAAAWSHRTCYNVAADRLGFEARFRFTTLRCDVR